jgi:hypothetical protein
VEPAVLLPFPPTLFGWMWLDVTIPVDPGLVGRSFYAQAFAADPGANALGLIFTDRLDALVGQR